MPNSFSRRVRFAGIFASSLALLALGAFAWGWQSLRKSLPPLDGTLHPAGQSAPADLARDTAGRITIRAANQLDALRALGVAHAQDRFFQMDLMRRQAAGELSALFGAAAVPLDRRAIVHRFRAASEARWAETAPDLRAWVEAYTEGVNAGLASLPAKPWEYLVLRSEPRPWHPTDTFLVSCAMALMLQETNGRFERDLTVLRDALGPRAVDFFAPLIGPDDSALDGSVAPLGEAPTAHVINLRAATAPFAAHLPPSQPDNVGSPGSNGLGVGGDPDAKSGALLAGDPHLDLALPNTWYRAALTWTDGNGQPFRMEGLTLPGVPTVVIGSNGHLAWTFTNSYADTSDLVEIDLNPTAPEIFYLRGGDLLEFERRTDTIVVKGAEPVTVESTWTIWGPLVGESSRGRPYALKWTFNDPAALDLELLRLATTTDFETAIRIAQTAGIAPQNILLAAADGRLTWTIAGRLPQRLGFDGRLPTKWTFGDRTWAGYLPPQDVPRLNAGENAPAVLWSANQRMLGGEALRQLGDGGYERPARAARIAHLLKAARAGNPALQPADLLAIQLDTQADWLAPWLELLRETLAVPPFPTDEAHTAFRQAVERDCLRAETNATGYRLLRAWVRTVTRRTLEPIFARCLRQDPAWSWGRFNVNPAVYSLHRDGGRLHLLAADYPDWAALRRAAIEDVINELDDDGLSPGTATWGEHNRARIRHPFSRLLPAGLGAWLDLPADPLPGDHHVPRVQTPAFGASARFVVRPGQEAEGILEVPGGQSGHPLSPFYRAGHRDWVEGRASPLQPGPAVHTLKLLP